MIKFDQRFDEQLKTLVQQTVDLEPAHLDIALHQFTIDRINVYIHYADTFYTTSHMLNFKISAFHDNSPI